MNKYWDSGQEETSSEEDFEHLQLQLERHKRLPKSTVKMLRNVISNTYKERKYPGRFGRNAEQPPNPHDSEDESDGDDMLKLTPWRKKDKSKQKGLSNEVLDSLKGISAEE
jgi:hypothetical protein